MSVPIAGGKSSLCIPKICVCKADFINAEIKRERYKGRDRKNYCICIAHLKQSSLTSNFLSSA